MDDEIEFTLTPVDEKEIKKKSKIRADFLKELGIKPNYRKRRSRRR